MTSAIPKYHLKAGDTVLLYMSQGEGFYTAWFNGYWFENFDGSGLALKDGSGCQKNCNAVLLDNGQTVWWVKIKTKEGEVGWVKDMNFNGMDALAQILPRTIPLNRFDLRCSVALPIRQKPTADFTDYADSKNQLKLFGTA